MERWTQQLKETYMNMVNARLAEGTYQGTMIPDPSTIDGKTEVYTNRQQQRIANLLDTLTTVDNAPDKVQRTLDPRIKLLGLDPNDAKFKSDMQTYRSRLSDMIRAKGVDVPYHNITPDTEITGTSVSQASRERYDQQQRDLSKQKRDAITQAANEKAVKVQSIGAQQTAKASNTFTPKIKSIGTGVAALGASALGALGAAGEAAASVGGVYSTPDPKTRMQGEKTYNTDVGLGFNTTPEGELEADPAGMEAARRRAKEGRSFPTLYPRS